MTRFFLTVLVGLMLVGCNAPVKEESQPVGGEVADESETNQVEEEPEPGSLEADGLIPAEPVIGINHPMPMPKYETEGVGDDLEKLILTDFKKDLTLYQIYEFPSDSGKPEIVYVFTRTNDGRGYAVPDEGVPIPLGSIVHEYRGLADKMPGAKKFTNPTRNGATYIYPDREISFYNGDIVADFTLQWSWVRLEEGSLTSDLVILKRSKGEFKSPVIEKAQEIWFNEAMSEWRSYNESLGDK